MEYLRGISKQNYSFPSYLYLVYNFHAWLNDKRYTLNECEDIYTKVIQLENNYNERIEEEAQQITKENLYCCDLGDTLRFVFPSSKRTERPNIKEVIFRPYPYSKEIFSIEDTIKLKALLLDKQLDDEDPIFNLYILESNEEKFMMFDNQHSIGDTISLPISIYHRRITKGTWSLE